MSNYRRWNIGPLGTGDRTIVRAQQNERIVVDRIWLCNKDTSNRTVDVHHLPADDGAVADNFVLLHNHTINAKTFEVIESPIYLEPGDYITAAASATNAIIVTAYGRIV